MRIRAHRGFFDSLSNLGKRWRDKWHTLLSWVDNVKRIISFIPVLWQDWDFDARPGLYSLIKKKLERLEPCLRNGHLLNGERHARQIRVAIVVLDRIIEDRYDEEEFEPHEKKWGKGRFRWEPTDKTEQFFEMHVDRDNVRTQEDERQEREEFRAAMNRATARRGRDLGWVFKHIRRWHQHWWD